MAEFPFDGLDLTPTLAQARLIARMRELIDESGIDKPDVIQPRPSNPGSIELFWIKQKLCVVIDSDEQIDAMRDRALEEAA